jgi:hypothetical protein
MTHGSCQETNGHIFIFYNYLIKNQVKIGNYPKFSHLLVAVFDIFLDLVDNFDMAKAGKIEKVKRIDPYKHTEFDLFMEILAGGGAIHLNKIAEVLGVCPETLSEWRKDPRVIEAQSKAILKAYKAMKKVGANDWRMWDKVLDRAGLVVQTRADVTTNGKDLPAPIYTIDAE